MSKSNGKRNRKPQPYMNSHGARPIDSDGRETYSCERLSVSTRRDAVDKLEEP
jgi:hypothetical protein